MAIAFGAIAINQSSTTISGTNPCCLAGITGSIGVDDVSSVAVGGVAMTLIDKVLNPGTNGRFTYLWGLANPPTGSQSFTVNGSGSGISSFITYTGCAPTQAFTTNKNTVGDGGTALSVAVTTVSDNSWVSGYISSNNGNKWAAGASTTNRDTSDNQTFMDNNAAKTPAGSVTLAATNANAAGAFIAVALAPFVPNKTNFLAFM